MLSRHRTENSAGWRDGRTEREEGEWVREGEGGREREGGESRGKSHDGFSRGGEGV